VESETTLVWTKGGIELHTVSTVYLDLALVIFPGDTELNYSLRDGGNNQCLLVLWVLLEKAGVFDGGRKLCSRVRKGRIHDMGALKQLRRHISTMGGRTVVGLLELGL
jgi:hypothetical protein